jgi:hypothetical protein
MLDLTWNVERTTAPPVAGERLLVVVERATAHPRLLSALLPNTGPLPASVAWVWVVTPGAVVSWGALLAEPMDRTNVLMAALAERMEEARRRLLPLQRACVAASVPAQIHIVHGAAPESVVRVARECEAARVLLPTHAGTVYGQSPQELARALGRRLSCPVGLLD